MLPDAPPYALTDVSFAYPSQPEIPVLKNLSWTMAPGENWAFIGPSGCGKSTLLGLLAGLLTPDHGQVAAWGQPVQASDPRIGVVFQSYGLFPWKTVAQNIDLPLKLSRYPAKDRQGMVQDRLRQIGLEAYAQAFPRSLSGGQRQRVAIARALVLNPSILLLDEPFSALDALNRESLQKDVLALCQKNQVQLVLVTHQIEEAVYMANRILVFGDRSSPPQAIPNPAARQEDWSQPNFVAMAAHLRSLLRKEGDHV